MPLKKYCPQVEAELANTMDQLERLREAMREHVPAEEYLNITGGYNLNTAYGVIMQYQSLLYCTLKERGYGS